MKIKNDSKFHNQNILIVKKKTLTYIHQNIFFFHKNEIYSFE